MSERPSRDNCTWTQEEDDYILDHAHRYSYDFMGEKLGRTARAVQNRLIEINGADKRELTGMITASDLADILKKDRSTITRYIKEKGLPAKRPILGYKGADMKRKLWLIDPETFWKWAEKNRELFNFYIVEKHALSPEPEWVDEQRKIDFYKPQPRRRWTEEEKQEAIKLLCSGLTRKEVAKRLGRTVSGIRWINDKVLAESDYRR